MKPICPSCGAEDSLRQEVTVEYDTTRSVQTDLKDGKVVVTYGSPDSSCGFDEVTATQMIECIRCKETWEDEKDLVEGPGHEHRCTSCDWWGFNPWQHGIERPDCDGEVKPREEIPA